MPLTFTDSSDKSLTSGVKLAIYGRSGTGKTALACTAPNPKFLDFENGTLSLMPSNQMRMFGKAVSIPIIRIRNPADMEEAYQFVLNNHDPDENGDETLIFDSGTEAGIQLLRDAKSRFNDGRLAFGDMQDRVNELITKFRDLPNRHVVFIFRETRLGSEAATAFGPDLPSKTARESVPYMFDEVLHLTIGPVPEVGQNVRYLQTQPDFQYDAKDRSGALDSIEQPNLTNIINKIKNG